MKISAIFLGMLGVLGAAVPALAEDKLASYAKNVEAAGQGMTVWQTIQSGGWVMVLLGILSVLTLALVVFLFVRLRPRVMVPEDFSVELVAHLRERKYGLTRQLCLDHSNLVSVILLSGLDKIDRGTGAFREGVILAARRETAALWQTVALLSDVAAVAPMLGLLGTVLGMIQAFNTIAFQSAVVKPILLAGGVSKAMVTTAAGMVIAIVAVIFYSVFRTRVQEITGMVETVTTDVLNAVPDQAGIPEHAA
ncbi:MAG: MotA/TolQ/ExbB proton channel family protein [Candidatus Omnitrophica bacterium]|nr:MotA/TolQ/ExbB proton channel family protein [Candidatus Omnitrophota bacterium]